MQSVSFAKLLLFIIDLKYNPEFGQALWRDTGCKKTACYDFNVWILLECKETVKLKFWDLLKFYLKLTEENIIVQVSVPLLTPLTNLSRQLVLNGEQ